MAPSIRFWVGLLISAGVQVAATVWMIGPAWAAVWQQHSDVLRLLLTHPDIVPQPGLMHAASHVYVRLFGVTFGRAAWVAGTAGVFWIAWRMRHAQPHRTFAVAVFGGLLITPHLFTYDLIIVLIPTAVLWACGAMNSSLAAAMYLLPIIPLPVSPFPALAIARLVALRPGQEQSEQEAP